MHLTPYRFQDKDPRLRRRHAPVTRHKGRGWVWLVVVGIVTAIIGVIVGFQKAGGQVLQHTSRLIENRCILGKRSHFGLPSGSMSQSVGPKSSLPGRRAMTMTCRPRPFSHGRGGGEFVALTEHTTPSAAATTRAADDCVPLVASTTYGLARHFRCKILHGC